MNLILHTSIEHLITLYHQLSVIGHPGERTEAIKIILPRLLKSMPMKEILVVNCFLSMFNDWLSAYISEEKSVFNYDKRIRKAQEYIKENYHKPIKLPEIAVHVGLSEGALSRLFRKQTGGTYIDYLNNVRIEQAVDMLRKTGDLLSEIAYSCGFSSNRHFTKMFKRKKGMAPGIFRKNL